MTGTTSTTTTETGLIWPVVSLGFTVHTVGAPELLGYADRLHVLYRRCFAGPPWREPVDRLDGFPARLDRHLANEGAHGVVVLQDLSVVGAIYGWPSGAELAAGSPFDDALAAAVSPQVARRLVAPAVTVAELMVDPDHQRRGLGRALLGRFVEEAPSAWLCTHPDAPAAALYRQEGWRQEVSFEVRDAPLVLFTWRAAAQR